MFELRSLSHRFPNGSFGIRSISLELPFSGLTVLAGANGAGKTLLSRHLLGLVSPTSGEIRLEGTAIQRCLPQLRRRVGLVFQDADSQFIGQSVEEDIAFGLEQRADAGAPHAAGAHDQLSKIAQRVEETLDAFELGHLKRRDPHGLSGGEKRRLAIAAVAASGPAFMVLDEPFANLDYRGVSSVLRHVLAIRDAGVGVLVITHEIEKTLAHAERLIVLQSGELAADGPPAELLDEVGRWGLRRPREPLEELTWLA